MHHHDKFCQNWLFIDKDQLQIRTIHHFTDKGPIIFTDKGFLLIRV